MTAVTSSGYRMDWGIGQGQVIVEMYSVVSIEAATVNSYQAEIGLLSYGSFFR